MLDTLFYWTGALVFGTMAFLLAWLLWTIIGNMIGGYTGALRYRRLRLEHCPDRLQPSYRWVVRQALSCWAGGNRYDGKVGKYWAFGPLEVPVDGRSPIPPERWPG
jgi:hypothetical protein